MHQGTVLQRRGGAHRCVSGEWSGRGVRGAYSGGSMAHAGGAGEWHRDLRGEGWALYAARAGRYHPVIGMFIHTMRESEILYRIEAGI